MGDAINYLEDNMAVEVVFYDGKAISVEIAHQRGARDHHRAGRQGRHLGQGHEAGPDLATGFEISVPSFVESGDKIEIDTRTHEYRKRV